MKTSLTLLAICGIMFNCTAQKSDSLTFKNKEYYVQKSKNQLTTGLIFLGASLTLFALTATNKQGIDDIGTNILLIGGGSGCLITSAIFFISSASNKDRSKKAIAFAGFNKSYFASNFKVNPQCYPAIGIRIHF